MDASQALAAFSALSQPVRLDMFRALARAGDRGMLSGEMGAHLGLLQNTTSANLGVLAQAGLIRKERQGREIRYFADMEGMRDLLAFLMQDCCGGQPELCQPLIETISHPQTRSAMTETPKNVLFLCTGNSARSILAEAILNRLGQGRFKAYSAGSQPQGKVHPLALDQLRRTNHDVSEARSKNWDEFAGDDAPKMDFVFTVCDNAAAETCPIWPGQPVTAHWGLPDPAAAEGSEAEQRLAFSETYKALTNRLSIFINLPLEELDKLSLQKRLDEIGASAAKEKGTTPA